MLCTCHVEQPVLRQHQHFPWLLGPPKCGFMLKALTEKRRSQSYVFALPLLGESRIQRQPTSNWSQCCVCTARYHLQKRHDTHTHTHVRTDGTTLTNLEAPEPRNFDLHPCTNRILKQEILNRCTNSTSSDPMSKCLPNTSTIVTSASLPLS